MQKVGMREWISIVGALMQSLTCYSITTKPHDPATKLSEIMCHGKMRPLLLATINLHPLRSRRYAMLH